MSEGQLSTTEYQVKFFRIVLNDAGVRHRCILDAIRIRRARSRERAVAAAQHRFRRKQRILSWDHLAHGYDIDELPCDR